MQEEWRDIVIEKNGVVYDYTGLYQVSNLGRVKTLGKGKTQKKDKILKTKPSKNGYVIVNLYKEGNRTAFYIHRLVATMFIPNPNNLAEVNHISEIRHENHVENLEWCDREYNTKYGTRLKKISDSLKGKPSYRKGKSVSEERKQKQREVMKGKNGKKVICLETGQVFGCIKEASEWCGLKSPTGINACCKGKRKTAGNYHWQYVD